MQGKDHWYVDFPVVKAVESAFSDCCFHFIKWKKPLKWKQQSEKADFTAPFYRMEKAI